MPLRRLPLAATLLTALALQLPAAAWAAGPLKPGLWQFQVDTSVNGGPAQNLAQMLAQAPPQVRQEMQAQLAKQGLAVDDQGLKICLSPQVAALEHPPLHLNGTCKETWSQGSGSRWNFSFSCTGPDSTGQGHIDLTSPTAYTTDYTARVSPAPGVPVQTIQSSTRAHWLAADCGNVAALAPPGQTR